MEKDYIVAPERIIRKLDEAEQAAVAINGLMEDVIDPAFYGYRCSGLLDAWSEETGGDKGRAALRWIQHTQVPPPEALVQCAILHLTAA